jgi:hypothetical protein
MKDELYKALSKGYADEVDQLDALDLIEELQAEVKRLREALVLIKWEYDPSDYGGIAEAMFTIAGEALTKPPGDTNE